MMLRRWIPVGLFCLLLLPTFVPDGAARPVEPPRLRIAEPPAIPPANASAREDTSFLFAASGPGSYGSPGTTERGYNFDGASGAGEPAGWFGVDKTAQEGAWWHLASTEICAGTGTDMSQALPFDYPNDPVNDHALWCGRQEVCSWAHETGYGNHWQQYTVVDLSGHIVTDSLTIRYAYRADFEGDVYDWFEVRVDSAGTWKTVLRNDASAEQSYQEIELMVGPDALGGVPAETRVGFYFQSDRAWSDEDGLYQSDVGAVWLDNLRIDVDGAEVFAADFEDGLEPARLSFETEPSAGIHAELRSNLFQETFCIINHTRAWAFWEEGHYTSGYPSPVIPYGPPYIDEAVQSPVLEVDAQGNPIELGPEFSLYISYWMYSDFSLNALIFPMGYIAARVEGQDYLGSFVDFTYWWDLPSGWFTANFNVTMEALESADEGTITGVVLRLGVLDACPFWCDINGDGTGHTPAPYYDNIQVMITDRSAAEWWIPGHLAFQDNFSEVSGKVRIDIACDLAYQDPPLVIGDSTVVELDMDPLGGIASSFNPDAGELRPELRLWWRVVAGPHAGLIELAQADPDASDGIFSPFTGTQDWGGVTWGTMQADSAASQGEVAEGKYAFDFAEDYFEAGDLIEYFFRAEAENGTVSTRPEWAMSSDPDLRSRYTLRCLPTAGTTMLYVEDGRHALHAWEAFRYNGLPAWEEAFRYNGYSQYDVYVVQAPTSGFDNGLAGRAEPGQLAPYEIIVWDSGNIPSYTICTLPGCKTEDDVLLADWLANTPHDVGLWVMGNMIANDLGNAEPFLAQVLGASLLADYWFYHDLVGIFVPRVFATHPALEYLGGAPSILADGGCPSIENFDAILPVGELVEVSHEWEDDGGLGIVAGILNRDPDGNGTELNDAGHPSRVLFNPFGYGHVRDDGYGLPAGTDYARLMVGHALANLFARAPGAPPDGAPVHPAITRLDGAWPNPFNPATTIRFSLASRERVRLAVYDVSGRRIRSLQEGTLPAGEHELVWDGRDAAGHRQASGVYFVRFRAGGQQQELKLVLLQ